MFTGHHRMNVRKSVFLVIVLAVFSAWPVMQAYAVFVSPTFVVFDKNTRTARITVNNRSNQIKVLTFEWQRRVITADGSSRELKDGETYPGYRPADPYIKFSPRKIILKPFQHQSVRLALQRPVDMAPGEYRSHFFIKEEQLRTAEMKTKDEKGLSGQVIVNVNKSMPVFVRQGETSLHVDLQKADLIQKDGQPYLSVLVTNDSTRSTYGRVELSCQLPDGEFREKYVSLRIYSEVKRVEREIPLKDKEILAKCGALPLTMQLVAVGDFEYGGKPLDEMPVSIK